MQYSGKIICNFSEKVLAKNSKEINELFNFFVKHIRDIQQSDEELKEAIRFPIAIPNEKMVKKLLKFIKDINASFQINNRLSDQDERYIIEELEKIIELFNCLIQDEFSPNLLWLELTNNQKVILCSAPKNIDLILKDILFNKNNSVILTSATLCQSGKYDYQIKNLGFPDKEHLLASPKPSPFPFEENTLTYIPEEIAYPQNKDLYINDIAEEINKLVKITKGRTLVLFTAKEDLNKAFDILSMRNLKYNLVKQSDRSSQSSIIKEFKNTKGVLLVTGIFWEGIDISGPDLSSVIIAKLPFPVPDPIIEYKIKQVTNRMDVLVPEMLMKLRQGIGRLIRSSKDVGIISILDSRISSRSTRTYKNAVLNSLVSDKIVSSIKDVELFANKNIII